MRAYIVEAATGMFAEYGRPRITMKALAEACALSESTIRRHVCDMHYLFRLVLTAHLDMLLAGISEIPDHHIDRRERARAEYRRLTRNHLNRRTLMHDLFVRHRSALPPDQLDPLEDQRRMIGFVLAGDEWDTALDLLDGNTPIDRIEGMFAAKPRIAAQRPQPSAPHTPYASQARPFLGPRCRPDVAPSETVMAAAQATMEPPGRQAA